MKEHRTNTETSRRKRRQGEQPRRLGCKKPEPEVPNNFYFFKSEPTDSDWTQLETACHQQSPTHLFPLTTFSLSISVSLLLLFLCVSLSLLTLFLSNLGFRSHLLLLRFASPSRRIRISRFVSSRLISLLSILALFLRNFTLLSLYAIVLLVIFCCFNRRCFFVFSSWNALIFLDDLWEVMVWRLFIS